MKSMQKFVAALLGTALCAVLLATAAFAQGGVAVTLPVSIRTAGADPEPNAAYTLCLQAVDNAPILRSRAESHRRAEDDLARQLQPHDRRPCHVL